MSTTFTLGLAFILGLVIASKAASTPVQIKNVGVGDMCVPGAAPVGPGGSWQIVEKNVKKVCAAGSSCRKGACNCDDLSDGTVMGMSANSNGDRVCRRIAGQKCSSSTECFQDVDCVKGVCTCDKTKKDFFCVDYKNDVTILA